MTCNKDYATQADARAQTKGISLAKILGFDSGSAFIPPQLPACAKANDRPRPNTMAGDFSCTPGSLYEGVCCDYLMAIWINESGQAQSCTTDKDGNPVDNANLQYSGPMQIKPNEVDRVNTDGSLDYCKTPDAQVLAARLLRFKKCGTNWQDPSCTISCSTDPNSPDLQAVGKYSGENFCQPAESVECVYGTGKSYCDVIAYYVKNQSPMPRTCDRTACERLVCNHPTLDGQINCNGLVYCPSGSANGNP